MQPKYGGVGGALISRTKRDPVGPSGTRHRRDPRDPNFQDPPGPSWSQRDPRDLSLGPKRTTGARDTRAHPDGRDPRPYRALVQCILPGSSGVAGAREVHALLIYADSLIIASFHGVAVAETVSTFTY